MKSKVIPTHSAEPELADVYDEIKAIRSTLDKLANDVAAIKDAVADSQEER